jgi:hypothetical protein
LLIAERDGVWLPTGKVSTQHVGWIHIAWVQTSRAALSIQALIEPG